MQKRVVESQADETRKETKLSGRSQAGERQTRQYANAGNHGDMQVAAKAVETAE